MKYKKILLLLFFGLFVWKGIFSEILDPDVKTLKGVDKVHIIINRLNEDANKIGLTEDRLKTVVELKLRRERIEIIDQYSDLPQTEDVVGIKKYLEESDKWINIPGISICITVVASAFNVDLEFLQMVKLRRAPHISCTATTWDANITGTHTNDPEFIVSALSQLVDKFLNDFYKANPKK